MNKIFLWVALLGSVKNICALQKTHVVPVVQGDLILSTEKGMRFVGYDQGIESNKHTIFNVLQEKVLDEKGNKLVLKPDDILVEFWALRSTNLERLQVSPQEFVPWFLPLSLFEGKKEGDTVTFYYQDNEKDTCTKIVLACRQLRDNTQRERFEDVLDAMKLCFHGTAHYWPEDVASLVQAGFLERFADATHDIIEYRHGAKSKHYIAPLPLVAKPQDTPHIDRPTIFSKLKNLFINIPRQPLLVDWNRI